MTWLLFFIAVYWMLCTLVKFTKVILGEENQ